MSLRSCGLLTFALLTFCFCASASLAAPTPCQSITVEGAAYTICEVDLRRYAVRLFWRKPDGDPYGSLAALPPTQRAGRLIFAMNAGMYAPDYRPVGLYVENGRELVRASTKPGPGNFGMRPNGIFYVTGETAGVLDTVSFLRKRPAADFATQSGPMLVIDGQLHPRFGRGHSRKFRDGVGVRDAHTAVFAISDTEVTFSDFARLFRDRLKCDNALFLDGGSAPSLYAPELRRNGNLFPLGPMIGVYERAP
ncbi:MAG: phosphodiester glycosidase family protein [Bradyrhizobiaceae bacterium]|nr:phosphodiester glycosidase family protein [Bradyrhizobiaceae bacterium]